MKICEFSKEQVVLVREKIDANRFRLQKKQRKPDPVRGLGIYFASQPRIEPI